MKKSRPRSKYRYKVIKRKTRMSALINGNSLLSIKYLKGKIVYSHPSTLGIFTFLNYEDAINWMDRITISRGNEYTIVRVLPKSRGKNPSYVCSELSTDTLIKFYEDHKKTKFGYAIKRNVPPRNIMCYSSVEVID